MPDSGKDIVTITQQERDRKGENWPYFNQGIITGTKPYQETFLPILNRLDTTFLKLAQEAREKTGQCNVLIVMGGNRPLRDLLPHVSFGVAVQLTDHRSEPERLEDERNGIFIVEGDVNDSATWKDKLDPLMQRHNVSGFDIICERALAGLDDGIPSEKIASMELPNNMWERLTPNGNIFMQLHKGVPAIDSVIKWIEEDLGGNETRDANGFCFTAENSQYGVKAMFPLVNQNKYPVFHLQKMGKSIAAKLPPITRYS